MYIYICMYMCIYIYVTYMYVCNMHMLMKGEIGTRFSVNSITTTKIEKSNNIVFVDV